MPISREMLLFLVDYCVWADQQMLSACSALTPEELVRDMNASHTNILLTLTHMYYAERVWLARLREDKPPSFTQIQEARFFDDITPEPTLQQLQQSWPAASVGLRQYAETTPDPELAGEFRAPDWSILRWKLLLHVVNHATMHRGQVGNMIRQLGHQPPCTDLLEYNLLHPEA